MVALGALHAHVRLLLFLAKSTRKLFNAISHAQIGERGRQGGKKLLAHTHHSALIIVPHGSIALGTTPVQRRPTGSPRWLGRVAIVASGGSGAFRMFYNITTTTAAAAAAAAAATTAAGSKSLQVHRCRLVLLLPGGGGGGGFT